MSTVLSWLQQMFGMKSKQQQYKSRVMKETADVDFSVITHDWDKAKRLYDELKKKCHPDLYTGEQNEAATRIFQILMQKKYDYAELLKIKEMAEKELN